jgi:glycosyltransferase involved in cell wall biosynthesis
MKFVIEALGLTAGGGKELALNFLSRLPRHNEHEFVLLLPGLPEYAALSGPNLKCRLYAKPQSLVARHWFLNRRVPEVCVQTRADALLCLGNFTPRDPPCPTAVLLHSPNLVYREPVVRKRLAIREKLVLAYGAYLLRRFSPRVHVIFQTEAMKLRTLSLYSLNRERVHVIPNSFFLPVDTGDFFAPQAHESMRPFTFLCLTCYYPHKNLEILPEAMARLGRLISTPAECLVTICPQQHPGAKRFLGRVGSQSVGTIGVRNVGPIPRERLNATYRGADALILPTLLESYSRTYLEAMYFGLPILTSDRDFAHDRCQDAALYFDPLDADSVARTMARIMEDEALRSRLVERGRQILQQMPTWDQIAARFVQVLEAVSGRSTPSFVDAVG